MGTHPSRQAGTGDGRKTSRRKEDTRSRDHSTTLRESVTEECPDLIPMYDKHMLRRLRQ